MISRIVKPMTIQPSKPTIEQLKVGVSLGIDVTQDTKEVAAARIYDQVAKAIGHDGPNPATARQREYASSLGLNVSEDTTRVATVKISEVLFARNQQALRDLDLKPGDRVMRVSRFQQNGEWYTFEREFVISSI